MASEPKYPYACQACGHNGLSSMMGRALRCMRCQSRKVTIQEWDGWIDARMTIETKQTVKEQRRIAKDLERKYAETVRSVTFTADKQGRVRSGNTDV